MITTPSMGLKRWDQPNDIFSYVELSDNFALLDAHDHSSGKGVQIPTAGIVNSAIDATKLADDAVTANKIPTNSIAGSKLLNNGVSDTKLASPNNGVYRTLHQAQGMAVNLVGGSTYPFAADGSIPVGATFTVAPLVFPLVAAHYAVAGKTTKLRVLGVIGTNTVAPTSTLTLGLSSLTAVGGASGSFTPTLAAQLAGSTVATAAPAASTRVTLVGTDFDLPADGYYALTIRCTVASQAAGSLAMAMATLQVRHV
jgi:hypothetical protein